MTAARTTTTRKIVAALGIAGLLGAAVLRWAAPGPIRGGQTGSFWAAMLALAVVLSRIALGVADVARRRRPATRLLIPALVAAELALVALGRTSRATATETLVAVELLIVAAIAVAVLRRPFFSAGRPPEERIEAALVTIVPPAVARATSVEMTILASALAAPFRRSRPLGPGEFGYLERSPIRWLPFLIALTLPPDILLVHVVLGRHLGVFRWIITGGAVYALLWVIGIAVTMRRRPHRVSSDLVELHRGILGRASLHRRDVARVTVLPSASRRALRAAGGSADLLATAHTPLVEIETVKPVRVRSVLRALDATRLAVSVDEPEAFRRALGGSTPLDVTDAACRVARSAGTRLVPPVRAAGPLRAAQGSERSEL